MKFHQLLLISINYCSFILSSIEHNSDNMKNKITPDVLKEFDSLYDIYVNWFNAYIYNNYENVVIPKSESLDQDILLKVFYEFFISIMTYFDFHYYDSAIRCIRFETVMNDKLHELNLLPGNQCVKFIKVNTKILEAVDNGYYSRTQENVIRQWINHFKDCENNNTLQRSDDEIIQFSGSVSIF